MWPQIAYFIVMVIIAVVTRPKDPDSDPANLDEFNIPTAEEDRSIPVVFGTTTISGPNVVWHGDFDSHQDTKDHVKRVEYLLGFHMILCHGPIDTLIKIIVDDRDLYSVPIYQSSTIQIARGDYLGGLDKGGGIVGALDVMMGAADQTANSYLTSKQGPLQPAFRGVTGVVFNGGQICANSTSLAPWAFKVFRLTKGWQDDVMWYPAKAHIGLGDMNVAHIMYECITNKSWGMGYPVESINDTVFRATADYYFNVQMGLSLQWTREGPVEDFMRLVIDHCAGIFGLDNGGLFVFKASDTGSSVPSNGSWFVGQDFDVVAIP